MDNVDLYIVIISDEKNNSDEMDYFLTESQIEVASFDATDVSDIRVDSDYIYAYGFYSEIDALHFILRFGGELSGRRR